ncbi:hypothetical protein AWW67_08860 [Roseivirga seohaensis]|uniref:Uncharacterized protein n=1 Tax=Roseivirga seohaensis TaxID=1914963 RepID=A0A150XQA9_9BACT|nr:hypothetical protein [Roseivirga seohaensis]KYG80920.1 hypothetical protein AWW67_08860 [Roseivirga seohaensis]
MTPEYGEEIYEILSKLIGLKFKAQIKDSGIQLKKIYRITDLETRSEYYSIIIDNEHINFKSKAEFIKGFILLLEDNINEFHRRFEELQKTRKNRWTDENQIFMEHDEIGYYSYKQSKLLNKMREFEK